jgi:DNA polymerase-3 subunit beta
MFLLDGLSAVDAAQTRFAFTQANRPAVLGGLRDGEVNEDYRYLLMPVRLTG